jgi:uncharacterized membrane protein
MQVVSILIFVLVEVVVAAFIVATTGQLPERVASHFAAGGLPNGWMTHDGYLAFMLAFAVLLPAIVVAGVGLVPHVSPRRVNIPHRHYWLAPERRAATFSSLASRACWLGCLIAVFLAGLHYAILEANAAVPPRLPADLFWTLLVAFVVGIALWISTLYLRFSNVS